MVSKYTLETVSPRILSRRCLMFWNKFFLFWTYEYFYWNWAFGFFFAFQSGKSEKSQVSTASLKSLLAKVREQKSFKWLLSFHVQFFLFHNPWNSANRFDDLPVRPYFRFNSVSLLLFIHFLCTCHCSCCLHFLYLIFHISLSGRATNVSLAELGPPGQKAEPRTG